jgi:hypothetical protein
MNSRPRSSDQRNALHLDVGGVLQDDVVQTKSKQWREAGRPVGEIVSNIVGVLYVGITPPITLISMASRVL